MTEMTKIRTCLRIPVKIAARIMDNASLYDNGVIIDISSSGIAIIPDKKDFNLNRFVAEFRLPLSFTTVKAGVETRHREDAQGKEKIGCAFIHLEPRDRNAVEKYISGCIGITLYRMIFNTAVFLLCIDAGLRLFGYFINFYYGQTLLAKDMAGIHLSAGYGLLLLAYAAATHYAFAASDKLTKKNLVLGLSCGIFAFIFIFSKTLLYYKMRVWQYDYIIFKAFFLFEYYIMVYMAFALFVNIASFKRSMFLMDLIKDDVRGLGRLRRHGELEKAAQ